MGLEVAPWLGMGNGRIGCAKRGWAMAPLLPVGWGWAMAALCGQGWDREGCAPRRMYFWAGGMERPTVCLGGRLWRWRWLWVLLLGYGVCGGG